MVRQLNQAWGGSDHAPGTRLSPFWANLFGLKARRHAYGRLRMASEYSEDTQSSGSSSSASLSLITQLLTEHPSLAVSVWRPPTSSGDSCVLMSYTDAFLSLCDAASFANTAFESVLMIDSALFLSKELEEEVRTSTEKLYTAINSIISGGASLERCTFTHISRVGIARRVRAELFGVYNDSTLSELLITEVQEPDEMWTASKAPSYSTSVPDPPPPTTPATETATPATVVARETKTVAPPGARARRRTTDLDGFACSHCKATQTTLRRCGACVCVCAGVSGVVVLCLWSGVWDRVQSVCCPSHLAQARPARPPVSVQSLWPPLEERLGHDQGRLSVLCLLTFV